MAVILGTDWLVQQVANDVILFHRHTQEEVVKFDINNQDSYMTCINTVAADERLSSTEKIWAGWWFGYFYARSK